jgi:hypothetical protein
MFDWKSNQCSQVKEKGGRIKKCMIWKGIEVMCRKKPFLIPPEILLL